MNNDISSDFVKRVNFRNSQPAAKNPAGYSEIVSDSEAEGKSSDCFYAMGAAKVNMDRHSLEKNTREAIERFRNDPDSAIAQVEFCDSLVDKGYSLEDAIGATDAVFSGLRKEETYRS